MKASDVINVATKVSLPWAQNATVTYKTIPPNASAGPSSGRASFNDGFPPLTFKDPGSGGIPPYGDDMNGVLNVLSSWTRYWLAGGTLPYDAAFQTLIGGYPNGAIVAGSVPVGWFWRSTVDDNMSNPNAEGAGWVPFPAIPLPPKGLLLTSLLLANNLANLGSLVPPTTTQIHVRMVGGGGCGGHALSVAPPQGSMGCGGNSGSYVEGWYSTGWNGAVLTIGIGGTAGAPGGATTLTLAGNPLTATGGIAGRTSTFSAASPFVTPQTRANDPPTGGTITNATGNPGQPGIFLFNGVDGVTGGTGGSSLWGGGGVCPGANVVGGNASGYGAGGGGAANTASGGISQGGVGTNGYCVIDCYNT